MDTAKVDIKKLQLLNDRISQCIDALNQVRLSVHGLSHSTGVGTTPNPMGIGIESGGLGYSQDPRFAGLQAQSPWSSGLAHTSLGYGQGGLTPPVGFGTPMGVPQSQFGAFGPFGIGGQTPAFGAPIGLSHTGLDVEAYSRPVWADPFLAARVAQTFPYARYAVPPVISIY